MIKHSGLSLNKKGSKFHQPMNVQTQQIADDTKRLQLKLQNLKDSIGQVKVRRQNCPEIDPKESNNRWRQQNDDGQSLNSSQRRNIKTADTDKYRQDQTQSIQKPTSPQIIYQELEQNQNQLQSTKKSPLKSNSNNEQKMYKLENSSLIQRLDELKHLIFEETVEDKQDAMTVEEKQEAQTADKSEEINSNDTEYKNQLLGTEKNEQKSCWQCYNLISNCAIEIYGKHFCQLQCIMLFEDTLQVLCDNLECKKPFIKYSGTLLWGKWYCGQTCITATEQNPIIYQISKDRLANYFTEKIEEINEIPTDIQSLEQDQQINDVDLKFDDFEIN